MDIATVRSLSSSLRMAGIRVTRLRRRGRLGYVAEATNRLGGRLTVVSATLEGALRALCEQVERSMYVLGRELTNGATSGPDTHLRCQQGHPLPDRWAYECHGCSGSLLGRGLAS